MMMGISNKLVNSFAPLMQQTISAKKAAELDREELIQRKQANLRDSGLGHYAKADIRTCEESVFKYAETVSRALKEKKPISRPTCLLCGDAGRGKTYSAAACLIAAAPYARVKFTSAQNIVELSKARTKEANEQLSRFKGTGFLAIDDLGNEQAFGIQAIKEILDSRMYYGKPTIITMQPKAERWRAWLIERYGDITGEALLSRFNGNATVYIPFTGQDMRR